MLLLAIASFGATQRRGILLEKDITASTVSSFMMISPVTSSVPLSIPLDVVVSSSVGSYLLDKSGCYPIVEWFTLTFHILTSRTTFIPVCCSSINRKYSKKLCAKDGLCPLSLSPVSSTWLPRALYIAYVIFSASLKFLRTCIAAVIR